MFQKLLERSLSINEALYTRGDKHVSASMVDLALVKANLRDLPAAKKLLDDTESDSNPPSQRNDPKARVASTLAHRGSAYKTIGEYGKAKDVLEKAVNMLSKSYSPGHPQLNPTVTKLANVHADLGNIDSSRKMLLKVLNFNEATYGPNHPYVGKSLSNLGNLERKARRLGVAQKLMERALGILTQAYGENHLELVAPSPPSDSYTRSKPTIRNLKPFEVRGAYQGRVLRRQPS